MKSFVIFVMIAVTVYGQSVSASAPSTDSHEEFIQGSWRAQGTDPSGTHGWFQEWTFDKGKFKQTGYPPLAQEGSYRVLKTEGNMLTLELYEQKGTFGTDNSELEIVVDKKKDKLMIRGQGPYSRVTRS